MKEKRNMGRDNKTTFSETVKEISRKSDLFIKNRKNSNNLIDIILYSQSEDVRVLSACIRAFHKIFTHVIKEGEMYTEGKVKSETDVQNLSVELKFRLWLKERYGEVTDRLLELILLSNANVQELSLCTLMKFVDAEAELSAEKNPDKQLHFPVQLFEKIVFMLISEDTDMTSLISRFQEFLEYSDVRYYTMKTVSAVLKEKGDTKPEEVFLSNCFAILENVSMPVSADEQMTNFMSKQPDSESKIKMVHLKEHKKVFTQMWLNYLRFRLTVTIYKKVLMLLHEKVMPFMVNPLLLSDFLTESYNIGGAISLLSLNGLFILVHKYNLNYPDFYKKLYMLLEPSVFHVKYKARFFFLTDLFLTSTHLPAYLVAAFAKKLSRLALTAPPSGLTVIVPFIFNLIRRHPSCKLLLHRDEVPSDLKNDPFKMEERDPSKCCALESSLWEIKTLQSHFYHTVATTARKIDDPLTGNETDLSNLFETTTYDLFTAETKKTATEFPLTFEAPSGLFNNKDDKMKQNWTFV